MGQRAMLRASAGAFCGALVLALAAPAAGQTTGKATHARSHSEPTPDIVVTEAHIFLFKYALALRPDQMPYWGPVESALRDLSQQQPTTTGSTGGTNTRWKRLAAAAMPLIKTFDASQKRSLHALARAFGFEHFLASN